MKGQPAQSSTRIARQYTVGDWRTDREALLTSPGSKDGLLRPLEALRDRGSLRFLGPMRTLADSKKREGEGFAITALACAFLDYLAGGYSGQIYSHESILESLMVDSSNTGEDLGNSDESGTESTDATVRRFSFETGDTISPYVRFLRNELGLSRKQARSFYSDVRCSLLHDGMTRGGWLIRSTGHSEPIHEENGLKIIERDRFLDLLESKFQDFCAPEYWESRIADFVRHMDHICEIEHVHYFAYGANMDAATLRQRIGQSPVSRQAAILPGYQFQYNKKSVDGSGKGNVQRASEFSVRGWLYEMTVQDLKSVADCEKGYELQAAEVKLRDADVLHLAVIFVANHESIQDGLQPTADYRSKIESSVWKG